MHPRAGGIVHILRERVRLVPLSSRGRTGGGVASASVALKSSNVIEFTGRQENVHRVAALNVFSRRPNTTLGRTSKIGPIFGSSVNDLYFLA